MKVRFFSLLAALVIVVAGFLIYLKLIYNQAAEDSTSVSQDITIQSTAAPVPTATPVPVNLEGTVTALYPAAQRENNAEKSGYINASGKFVISPTFNSAGDFCEGFAVVTMGSDYLMIDSDGNIIYISKNPIGDFHNGAAIISRFSGSDALYGYIDAKGSEIIQPLYKLAADFGRDGTAYVYRGNGKYYLISKTGKLLQSFELDKKYNPVSIQDGYIVYHESENESYGVINLKGEEIFKPNYCEIRYLGDNLFALKKPDEKYYGQTDAIPAALFNANKEQLTDYTLYDLTSFYNGYASATDNTSTYFVGPDGKKAAGLPEFEGRGTVTLFSDVIKAELDGDLIYSRKDGTVIWQNDRTQSLNDSITAKDVKFKPSRNILVHYPELCGLPDASVQNKINAQLKDKFTERRTDFKENDMLNVDDSFQAGIINNLIIIERDGYDYEFGTAHGMPVMDYFFIDKNTGTFYTLKDLFVEGSDYPSIINEIIASQIQAQSQDESTMPFDGFNGIAENQYFSISEDTLTIYFYPYDIAAYAAGFPEFAIPFEDLNDYIDFNGAFWKAFN